jgi:hypothetical protein
VASTAVGLAVTTGQSASSAAPTAPGSAAGAKVASGAEDRNYDARSGGTPQDRRALAQRADLAAARPAVAKLQQALGNQAIIDLDGLTGTPRQLARLNGFLTGPAAGKPADIAMAYVRGNLGAFGLSEADLATLTLTRDYVDINGTHHLSYTQRIGGLPVFGNGLKAHVTKAGELISLDGAPVAGQAAPAALAAPAVASAAAAITRARADADEPTTAAGKDDTAQQVLFLTPGGLRRGWETVTMSAQRPAQQVIDAQTGRVLYRMSLTSDDSPRATAAAPNSSPPAVSGLAYPYFPGAPRAKDQVLEDFGVANWLPADASTLSGNNVHTYADVDGSNRPSATEEIPPATAGSWAYPQVPFHPAEVAGCDNPFPCSWDPSTPFSWQTNLRQDATQVFARANTWHDHLLAAPFGFTEAAGNFQAVNSSGQGLAGDAVNTETDDGAALVNGLPDAAHVNNANFSTPPDGRAPRMQTYLRHLPGAGPTQDRRRAGNTGDLSDTIYHEYTHGMSGRLVVDASGSSGLVEFQPRSMGEAWSDWYAMDFLVNRGLQADTAADGEVYRAAYDPPITGRTEALDCPVGSTATNCAGTPTAGPGGYTYGDFGKVLSAPEVHADGEIWAQTLWDLRAAVGVTTAESVVTRAMELSPVNPSYLDERNAIILADQAGFGGRHIDAIWRVFAHRGMGFFAASLDGDDTVPVEDFSTPPPPGAPTATLSGTVRDADSGGPAAGVRVAVSFQGIPGVPSPSAVSDAAGHYAITGLLLATYPKIGASGSGYTPATASATVGSGGSTVDFVVRRDWVATSGGARVTAFDGADFTTSGCGPGGAVDGTQKAGWGSTSDLVNGQPGPATPKSLTVALPRAVNVVSFAVDPSAVCGDDPTASTGDYRIETSTDGTNWQVAASGRLAPADRGRLNTVSPAAGTTAGVRFVRFVMVTPQVLQVGNCPSSLSGCDFLDMAEFQLFGV